MNNINLATRAFCYKYHTRTCSPWVISQAKSPCCQVYILSDLKIIYIIHIDIYVSYDDIFTPFLLLNPTRSIYHI